MTASRQDLRKANERSVFKEVINNAPLSRSQVSRNLSLNKVTVSEILNDYVEKDYMIEVGTGDSTKSGGRKPTLVTLNPKYGYFINIDLGPDQIKFMSNYLNGDIQQFTEIENCDLSIEAVLALIEKQIASLEITNTHHGLLGIGIAFYGIVDQNEITYSPFIDLKDTNLHDYLADKYQVPVLICNEANANAVYQRDFNFDEDCQNLICISLHRGVGAGIILNNLLYLGTNGEAGEIGNMVIRHQGKGLVRAEKYCSESNVISQIRQITNNPKLSLSAIADLAASSNPAVMNILDDFTNNLADIVNNVLVAYAPQKVVFVSDLMVAIPKLLIDVKKNIHHLTKRSIPMQIAANSRYSTQLGTYSLLLREIFDLGPGQIKLGN